MEAWRSLAPPTRGTFEAILTKVKHTHTHRAWPGRDAICDVAVGKAGWRRAQCRLPRVAADGEAGDSEGDVVRMASVICPLPLKNAEVKAVAAPLSREVCGPPRKCADVAHGGFAPTRDLRINILEDAAPAASSQQRCRPAPSLAPSSSTSRRLFLRRAAPPSFMHSRSSACRYLQCDSCAPCTRTT